MKYIIGLIASGKTTLFRQLNERKESYAVEIELPQSCLNDEKIKKKLLKMFSESENIETIIAHPYYLPKDFYKRIKETDNITYLDIPLKERLKRIKERCEANGTDRNLIFPDWYLEKEEKDFKKFKDVIYNYNET